MKIRKAVFPVAGLGTRVLPATKAMPKEMLTIVDKPLIQYVYDEAREAGIEHFVFVTGRNKAVIEDHFDRMPPSTANVFECWIDSRRRAVPRQRKFSGALFWIEVCERQFVQFERVEHPDEGIVCLECEMQAD